MQYRQLTTVLLVCVVLFAGCRQREETRSENKPDNLIDKARIKELVSEAAGMSPETFRRIIGVGSPALILDTIPNKSLSLCLLTENPDEAEKADFVLGHPNPARLADALVGGPNPMKQIKPMEELDYASFIRPSYITDLAWEMKDGRISGTVKFSVPDLYSGQTQFIIVEQDSRWTVTEFSMPLRNLTLRLNANGNWEKIEQ